MLLPDRCDLKSQVVVADNPVALDCAIPRRSFRQARKIKKRDRLVDARNPAATQWRLAFHALRAA